MFRIVTIEREFGSGQERYPSTGPPFGVEALDQQLTSEIAKRAQVYGSAVALVR